MNRFEVLLLAASLGIVVQGSARGENFAYTADARELIGHATVVDARPLAACLHRSVANAKCLPASDFLGPHGRLAAFTDIYWLLGTAGIAAGDAVLVVGDNPRERDFVAGMLYLSGQAAVTVLNRPISDGAGLPVSSLGPGTARGMLRQPIYEGTVRADAIVLRSELAAELQRGHPPTLVDGRPESAYWGETIRASRGGHLPGAQSLPMAELRTEVGRGQTRLPPGPFVVYGHDPFESVAYFTLARAGGRAHARVLPGGWVEWANHPALPMDAETYPDRVAAPVAAQPTPAAQPAKPAGAAVATVVGLLILITSGWYLRRKNKA